MSKWDPEAYHEHSSEQKKWGLELLHKIAFSGNERVVDLGCGDGKITAEIAYRVPSGKVLGIDKSEGMIRFAKENFSHEAFPNLTFTVKDIRDLDFDQEFDLAFSNAALHWVPDHASLLGAIGRGLRKGGRIIAQMGGKGNAGGILQVLDTILGSEKWAPYFLNFTPPYTFYDCGEYENLLHSSGFTIASLELIPKKMVLKEKESMAGWIRTTWLPYTRRVPENMQPDFIHEIVDTYIATHGFTGNGTLCVEMVRLEFQAVRSG
jgi:trans-aconitate methyltransferase